MNCIQCKMQPIKNLRCHIHFTAWNLSQLFSCKTFHHENYLVMVCQCCPPGCPSNPFIHLLIHPFFHSCERLIFCAWLINPGITKGICHSVASGINVYELYLNSYGSHSTYFGWRLNLFYVIIESTLLFYINGLTLWNLCRSNICHIIFRPVFAHLCVERHVHFDKFAVEWSVRTTDWRRLPAVSWRRYFGLVEITVTGMCLCWCGGILLSELHLPNL